MRWRRHSLYAKERANRSFFIFIMFFAVFGIIFLAHLLLLDAPPHHNVIGRARHEDLQGLIHKSEGFHFGPDTAPPARAPRDGVWQPVSGAGFPFYVYSAYVERRTVAAVRVIAATKTRGPHAVYCKLWLPGNRTSVALKAKVQAIREHWSLKFSAAFVLCLLRGTGIHPEQTAGASVAVVATAAKHRSPTNMLLVLDTEPPDQNQNTIHVCVKPIHFDYDREEWLVEWLEMNRILGVTHFYMYNNTISNQVACVLTDYINEGLITLLPWKLPIASHTEIRTEGMFAAFNDCLYRSMSRTVWLLVIDLDELILPRKTSTLSELLSSLMLKSVYTLPSKKPSAFLFRNAFFYVRWQDDPTAPVPLLTARKTRRRATPHALKNRSKFAVRPVEALELGNHFLWEHAPGGSSVGVPMEHAIMHHYRLNCEYDGTGCLDLPSTIDRTAHKFSEELWKRVQLQQNKFKSICSST